MLAAYADQSAAVILYAAIVAAMGLAHLGMWQYAWTRGLFTVRLGPDLFGYLRARGVVVPAVFLASIPVALVSPMPPSTSGSRSRCSKSHSSGSTTGEPRRRWSPHQEETHDPQASTEHLLRLAFLLPWAVWGATIAQDHGAMSWHVPRALAAGWA